ncbi:fused MFS/spermidine synthase [Pseudomonadota bacterium]
MKYILFALGALTMVIEFAIPRLIAPAYGYTMLSWTAIISVVMVSMTVGYYWGGKLTEQGEKTQMRIILFGCISSGWTVLIVLFGSSVVNILSLPFLGILFGPLVASLLFAAIPTFLNAAVVPMVISTFRQEAGMASGKGFSISTIGSIVGVIATGYILLPLFGIEGALLVGSGSYFFALVLYGARILGFVGLGIILE